MELGQAIPPADPIETQPFQVPPLPFRISHPQPSTWSAGRIKQTPGEHEKTQAEGKEQTKILIL